MVYKVIQTGPNSQLGGVKKGLFNVAYQVGIDEAVKIEPMAPASCESTIEDISKGTFVFDFLDIASV